ncbi:MULTISPECIES: PTS sugar transporter subunit IIA [Anaerofustis]|uniref:PTS sugar transporter subunit IIA n=1 Tax=Anaerofustis TaxID=264995 RepID=UPI00110588ED|nr:MULTISPECIES: PTS sugar transporter subunit IIA [Anaerofustis]MCO8193283.1 PTS sugar transporter subunit IIA [Anaerofustis sp. NSJ-163]
MIDEKNIYLNVKGKNYQDILTQIGNILYKKGYVKKSYVEALLEREELSPTGLPIKPWSIAIPHTDPKHVIKPCIIVFQLKESVPFKEMANPKETVQVKYVFGLVFTDGKKQLPLLSNVISITQDKESMNMLSTAATKDEILAAIKKYL